MLICIAELDNLPITGIIRDNSEIFGRFFFSENKQSGIHYTEESTWFGSVGHDILV